jgi:serine/threonine-protein kinase
MENSTRTPSPGDRVSNYEIIGLAGVGGMGFVYKARDTKLERIVALKFLPSHLTFSEKDRKRLLQEARSASTLDHPNIGVIHGIEENTDGQTFIVMAFYEGDTLASRIAAGPISTVEVVGISNQIGRGLSEAHRHYVIHRDIKPSNIVLTKRGVVKIVDFGLALILSDLSATRSLGVHGTAIYMAPEQIRRVPADRRSDIWALGVVLAEMLLGHHPFAREDFGATMHAILHEPPDCLDSTPPELQAITLRSLAKDPAKRYQGCTEFLADLERFSDHIRAAAAHPNDGTLSVRSVDPRELKRYAHNASSSSLNGDRRRISTRWLIGSFAILVVFAAFWASPLGQVVVNALIKHKPPRAAYEEYLSALSDIQRYDQSGNLDRAISELKSAVARDPQFALGFAELGEAYRLKYQLDHDKKWIDEALSDSKTALGLDNKLPAVYVTLGRIHNDSGNYDLAITEFQHALDLDSRNADALQGMAYGYENAARIKEAEEAYKKAVALRPDYWDGYNTLGSFYRRQRRFGEAIAAFQRAIELTPDNTESYNNLADVYLNTGNPQDLALAEKALKKSIEISPSFPAFANLGYLYLLQNRFPESAAMTEKALQLNDKVFVVWENLDWSYRWSDEPKKASAARDKALALLEEAAKTSPRDAQVQSHLALQYAGRHLREKALAHLESALALAPNDPDVLTSVSDAYEKIGEHTEAVKYADLSLHNGYTVADLRRDPDMQAVLADPGFSINKK